MHTDEVTTSSRNDGNTVLGDVYHCFLPLSNGHKLWYGTHRNENMEFQKNIFSGWKPNAYKLSKVEAEAICLKTNCQKELVENIA